MFFNYNRSDGSPRLSYNGRSSEGFSGVNSMARNMQFDAVKSQLRQVNEDGEETVVEVAVDTYALSVLALLMCKGTISDKTNRFY